MPKYVDIMQAREEEVFREKIEKSILPVISDKRFLHSWRGTFATDEFDEEARSTVIDKLNKLV
ncbi:MAG: hypothetical protein ACE5Z5_05270 [Candidatus Bathyarchaeia archaeon]